MISFGPNYLVNNAQMDEQHERLFDIFNALLDSLKGPQGNHTLERTFRELLDYAKHHFSTEDDLMIIYGYPEAEAHLREHGEFRKKAREMELLFSQGKSQIFDETVQFLIKWLSHHILQSDKKLGRFLAAKMPSAAPPPSKSPGVRST